MISETFNTDNLPEMRLFPDKFFDLGIIDPPYGIGEDGSANHTRGKIAKAKNYKAYSGNDTEPPSKEYFDELIRITKNQIIWRANHFISKIPYDSSCWLIWDKENGETDFADCELAWTSFKSAARKFKYKWQGMLQENMKNKEVRIHPNQKPIALYDWIFKNYSKPGFKVLDTHMGSQNSRISAYKHGLDYWGYEIDSHYFQEGEIRFQEFLTKYNQEPGQQKQINNQHRLF